MQPVFIAYAPGDEASSIIVDAYLRANGYQTHKTSDNRDLPSHDPDQTTHYWQALRAASAFILIWSRHTVDSVKVTCDWTYAHRRKLPIFVLALDTTPVPPSLRESVLVTGRPGPDTLARLDSSLKNHSVPYLPATPMETAFIDFICWFFDDVDWDYDPDDRMFPLQVRHIPNLAPNIAYRVKFLREPDENIWPMYANISRPYSLLVFEFDPEAYENRFFFQADAWVFSGDRWEPYSWIQCSACKRWQLASDEDDEPGLYESWCTHCKDT
ncbi:MAG: toll/interleukin-1 receptor domain-containing protein [Anaerolineae bacterium]|nr:toll/interleukin-1 receptor domain-containing protein [Anaerolineae bacterium]